MGIDLGRFAAEHSWRLLRPFDRLRIPRNDRKVMPFAAINGFDFCDKMGIVGEGNCYPARDILTDSNYPIIVSSSPLALPSPALLRKAGQAREGEYKLNEVWMV